MNFTLVSCARFLPRGGDRNPLSGQFESLSHTHTCNAKLVFKTYESWASGGILQKSSPRAASLDPLSYLSLSFRAISHWRRSPCDIKTDKKADCAESPGLNKKSLSGKWREREREREREKRPSFGSLSAERSEPVHLSNQRLTEQNTTLHFTQKHGDNSSSSSSYRHNSSISMHLCTEYKQGGPEANAHHTDRVCGGRSFFDVFPLIEKKARQSHEFGPRGARGLPEEKIIFYTS